MSFDIVLFPSSASPIGAAYDRQVVAASRLAGAVNMDIEGGTSSCGVPFEVFGGGGGVSDGDYAIRIKGAPGRSPDLKMPIHSVASAGDLCVVLTKG